MPEVEARYDIRDSVQRVDLVRHEPEPTGNVDLDDARHLVSLHGVRHAIHTWNEGLDKPLKVVAEGGPRVSDHEHAIYLYLERQVTDDDLRALKAELAQYGGVLKETTYCYV